MIDYKKKLKALMDSIEYQYNIYDIQSEEGLNRLMNEVNALKIEMKQIPMCLTCSKHERIIWCSAQGTEAQPNYENCKYEKKE